MRILFLGTVLLSMMVACKAKKEEVIEDKVFSTTDSLLIARSKTQENPRLQFALVHSYSHAVSNELIPFEEALLDFTAEDYQQLAPLVIGKSISEIQQAVAEKKLSYEALTLVYLYRIQLYETDAKNSLQAIISLNKEVLAQARAKDQAYASMKQRPPLYGIPVLLKDNIEADWSATTAGAEVLAGNTTENDAFITRQLRKAGALILGKANLSEWAYFFCENCPLGYSAVGGQTLNPFGRGQFESGGSSSGSAVAMAVNYAALAVGSETSGSIISPAAQNSIVGLKPTIGVLSRTGIVPISHDLDTPGPMGICVEDVALGLEAMQGLDTADESMEEQGAQKYSNFEKSEDFLQGKKIGVLKGLLSDSLYVKATDFFKRQGAELVVLAPENPDFDGFLTWLTADMKRDLPKYLTTRAAAGVSVKNVEEILAFNRDDLTIRAPYGQQLLEGIVEDNTSDDELNAIKKKLRAVGTQYFEALLSGKVDVVISVNNWHSGVAAVANLPCLTVPSGLKSTGEPQGLTFIGKGFTERSLLAFGYAYERGTQRRSIPENY